MPNITLNTGKCFTADEGSSILEAGRKAQVNFPYSCMNGRCGACKCRVISGVTAEANPEISLTEVEKSEGWVLACARTALTDLVIEVDELSDIQLPVVKIIPSRIHSIEYLTKNVVRVFLRMPPSAEFSFLPGQYVEVIGPGGVRRSYSIANGDFSEKLIELHIRAVAGGMLSEYWFKKAKVGDLLRLNGPLGTFFVRGIEKLNLVFLATGVGIAPVKSILESLSSLEKGLRPMSVAVFWGVREIEDLYFDVAELPGDFQFIPVLSRAGGGWDGASGYVQDVLLSMDLNLSDAIIFACGSDAMIRDAKKRLLDAGLDPRRFYSDAFVCSGTNGQSNRDL